MFTRRSAPRSPEGTRIYAIGDIHGRADLLRDLHSAITDDMVTAPAEVVVIYLGDYVDRGAESREVIDMMIEQPLDVSRAIHLAGNHEALMLEFLADHKMGGRWLNNGGYMTLASYGVPARPSLMMSEDEDLESLRDGLALRLPEKHLEFFGNLELMAVLGDYAFVHAGVRPGVPLDRQIEQDLLWIRRPFLTSSADFGKVVVHGHTITDAPDQHANRIGIDTGAYLTNRLTCLVVEGENQRFLTTGRRLAA